MRFYWIIYIYIFGFLLLGISSCKDIQTEGVEHTTVQVELSYDSLETNGVMRATNQELMTGINTEVVVLVPSTATFTEDPRQLQGVLGRVLVDSTTNKVSLTIPYDVPLHLYLYRYSETLTLADIQASSPVADSFGRTLTPFSVASTDTAQALSLGIRPNGTAGFTSDVRTMTTTEAGGSSSFSITLTKKPKSDVTLSITSSDTSEGTLSTSALTFNSSNWNTAQTVTVTGSDDFLADGDQSYTLTTALSSSLDPDYRNLTSSTVTVTNTDDETSGISVSNPSNNTSENGMTATFTVVLNSQPTADVSMALRVSDATEGSLSPSSLTFTANSWSTAQTVTVTGVDDNISDGDISYTVNLAKPTTTDATYSAVAATSVTLVNNDDEAALSGKLAQAYVNGATVFADKLITGQSTGDNVLGTGELSTTSSASGDYSLVLPPDYGAYVLVSIGGTITNSLGGSVAASPMLAPAPDAGQNTSNLTPLTTLVVSQPELKTKLDALGGWNTDIASTAGVDGRLLRVAKTAEVFWKLLSVPSTTGTNSLVSTSNNQFAALHILATQLNQFPATNMSSTASLATLSQNAMGLVLDNTPIVDNATFSATTRQSLLTATQSSIDAVAKIPETGAVRESDIVASLEAAVDNSTTQFAKAADLNFGISFAPTIQNLNLLRIAQTQLQANVIATDDGGVTNLTYAWSFTNTCAVGGVFNATVSCFTGAITFDNVSTNPVTLTNYSDNVTGTLTVTVSDQGGANTQSSISIQPGDFIFVP